jgi:hypothetical protein
MDIIHRAVSSISAEDQVTNAEAITVSGLMESSEPRLRDPEPHKANLHQTGQLHLSAGGKHIDVTPRSLSDNVLTLKTGNRLITFTRLGDILNVNKNSSSMQYLVSLSCHNTRYLKLKGSKKVK